MAFTVLPGFDSNVLLPVIGEKVSEYHTRLN